MRGVRSTRTWEGERPYAMGHVFGDEREVGDVWKRGGGQGGDRLGIGREMGGGPVESGERNGCGVCLGSGPGGEGECVVEGTCRAPVLESGRGGGLRTHGEEEPRPFWFYLRPECRVGMP